MCNNCGHPAAVHGVMGACDGCDDRYCASPDFVSYDNPCMQQFNELIMQTADESLWHRKICNMEKGHEGDHVQGLITKNKQVEVNVVKQWVKNDLDEIETCCYGELMTGMEHSDDCEKHKKA